MRRLFFLFILPAAGILAQPGTVNFCQLTADRQGVRPNGQTELVGNMKLTCEFNPGSPAPSSAPPRYNFLLTVFGGGNPLNVTSRPLVSTTGSSLVANESLLVLDDPPPFGQAICSNFPFVTPLTANGSIPTLPSTCLNAAGQAAFNTFYGAALPSLPNARNSLVWLGVPFDPPSTTTTRIFRTHNVRVNTQGLRPNDNIFGSIQMTGPGGPIRVNNPEQIIGVVNPEVLPILRNADNTAALPASGFIIQNSCADPGAALARRYIALLQFAETSAAVNGFKPRTTARGAPDTSPTPAAQNDLHLSNFYTGVLGTTETGVYNPNFRIPGVVIPPGLADFGTRFKAAFRNIPTGLDLFVSRCATSPSGGLACLARSEVSAYSPFPPGTDPVQIPLFNGAGTAVWEILDTSPNSLDTFNFGVFVSSPGGANRPQPGIGTVNLSFAPISTVNTASATAPLPRFADTSTAANLLNILSSCTNVPLFSYANAASGNATAVAPDSIVSGYGLNLATGLATATLPLPTRLNTTRLEVTDSRGTARDGSLFFVSQNQINFLIPPGTAPGPGTLTVFNGSTIAGQGPITIVDFAPGIFTADNSGTGPAAAQVVIVEPDGSQTVNPTSTFDASGKAIPIPFTVGPKATALVLYTTGTRGFQSVQPNFVVRIGDQSYTPFAVASHSIFPGLDQVNVLLSPGPTGGTGPQTVFFADQMGNKLSNEVIIDISGYFLP